MLVLTSIQRQYAWPTTRCFAVLALFLWLAGAVTLALAQPSADVEVTVKTAIQEGRLDRAMQLVRNERKNAPDDVHWYFLEGVIQAQQGQRDKAIETFTKITKSHPDQSEAYNNLGVLYASKGELEKSKSFLEKALQTHPSYAAAHRNLSDLHGRLAQQNYAKALQISPTNKVSPPQLTLLGRIGKDREPEPVGTPQASAISSPAPTASIAKADARAEVAGASMPSVSAIAKPAAAIDVNTSAGPGHPDKINVEKAVMNWAQAWSNRDMPQYYAAYASNFVPAGRLSRTDWESERRLKIVSKKSISVGIKQLKITLNGDTALAKFKQIYTSDNFKGNSPKTLEMVRSGNSWLIVRESVN